MDGHLTTSLTGAHVDSSRFYTNYHLPIHVDTNHLDNVESPGKYRAEYHPVQIGDVFAGVGIKFLHKLGFGGSATVWLVRDLAMGVQGARKLMSLKIVSAEQTSGARGECGVSILSAVGQFVPYVKIP